MSRWIDHTIWWHVYPLGFAGALYNGPVFVRKFIEATKESMS